MLEDRILKAHKNGVSVVAAAGNDDGGGADPRLRSRASFAVAGGDPAGGLCSYSSFGPQVAVLAPACPVESADAATRGSRVGTEGGGSSAATAVASTLVAALRGLRPDATWDQVEGWIRDSARLIDGRQSARRQSGSAGCRAWLRWLLAPRREQQTLELEPAPAPEMPATGSATRRRLRPADTSIDTSTARFPTPRVVRATFRERLGGAASDESAARMRLLVIARPLQISATVGAGADERLAHRERVRLRTKMATRFTDGAISCASNGECGRVEAPLPSRQPVPMTLFVRASDCSDCLRGGVGSGRGGVSRHLPGGDVQERDRQRQLWPGRLCRRARPGQLQSGDNCAGTGEFGGLWVADTFFSLQRQIQTVTCPASGPSLRRRQRPSPGLSLLALPAHLRRRSLESGDSSGQRIHARVLHRSTRPDVLHPRRIGRADADLHWAEHDQARGGGAVRLWQREPVLPERSVDSLSAGDAVRGDGHGVRSSEPDARFADGHALRWWLVAGLPVGGADRE